MQPALSRVVSSERSPLAFSKVSLVKDSFNVVSDVLASFVHWDDEISGDVRLAIHRQFTQPAQRLQTHQTRFRATLRC